MLPDHGEEEIGTQVHGTPCPPYRFVDGDRANRNIEREDHFSDRFEVPPGGEVHQGVSAVCYGCLGLLSLEGQVTPLSRSPDIDIDLHPASFTDGTQPVRAHGIGRDYDMPPGHRTGKIPWILPFLSCCRLNYHRNPGNTLLDQGTHKTDVRCATY